MGVVNGQKAPKKLIDLILSYLCVAGRQEENMSSTSKKRCVALIHSVILVDTNPTPILGVEMSFSAPPFQALSTVCVTYLNAL